LTSERNDAKRRRMQPSNTQYSTHISINGMLLLL
jgi:hypothetical protein